MRRINGQQENPSAPGHLRNDEDPVESCKSDMPVGKTSWHRFPAEIRLMILNILLQDGCSLAGFATVSPEWQTIIERHNFAQIYLTPSRLADFGSVIHRNRALVGYLWLCLELGKYDCPECAPQDACMWSINNTDNTMIATAFLDLFSTLSTWEPNGNLVLDISVYSTSDSEHWFRYLTFGPDIPFDESGRARYSMGQVMPIKIDDDQHRYSALPGHAINRVFELVMDEGPFEDDDKENQWWEELPSVPAVTSVLLRRQNRRRWKPTSLARMFSRLPRLQEIYYEPWREWQYYLQPWTDQSYQLLLESLASSKLQRLILFEDFNQQYPDCIKDCHPIRIPTPGVSWTAAIASLELEHLSASFIVDASHFFSACKPSWKWPNLISLTLTSQMLSPDESSTGINNMLRAAAAAAINMPNLKTMEIWNGREGLAALFRYQSTGDRQSVITWRGTWELVLKPSVTRAWEVVAREHCRYGCIIVKELLDIGLLVKSHGDAIQHLKLSNQVIRPVSLRQIRMEHTIRGGGA